LFDFFVSWKNVSVSLRPTTGENAFHMGRSKTFLVEKRVTLSEICDDQQTLLGPKNK
jgi:hypothetical protein